MIENVLTYSIGSIIWGIVIAFMCTGVVYSVVRICYSDRCFKPLSYVISIVLWLILAYNSTVICSAFAMKSDISFIEGIITRMIQISIDNYDYVSDREVSAEILEKVLQEHPILYHCVGLNNFEGLKLSEIPHAIAKNFYYYLDSLIWKKVLWSLAFLILGTVLIIITTGRSGSERHRSRTGRNRVGGRVSGSRRRPASRKR